jgi:hypothetical protein
MLRNPSIMALVGSSCNLIGSAGSLQEFQFVNPLSVPLDGISPDARKRHFNKLASEIYNLYQALSKLES